MHNRNRSVYHLVVAALLTAIGILIPLGDAPCASPSGR